MRNALITQAVMMFKSVESTKKRLRREERELGQIVSMFDNDEMRKYLAQSRGWEDEADTPRPKETRRQSTRNDNDLQF